MQVNGYTQEIIQKLLGDSHMFLKTGKLPNEKTKATNIVGSIFAGALEEDTISLELAAARLGIQVVNLSTLIQHSLLREEYLHQIVIADRTVDLLVSSIIDSETFGTGRETIESIASTVSSPFIGLSDEIFSSQSALSEILSIYQFHNQVERKKIVLSWGFGTKFVSPNMAHSLLVFLPLLGADVHVLAPSDFGILNRVKKQADRIATHTGSEISFSNQFDSISPDTNALIALNWCSLDDYSKPERNKEKSQKYKDWYFTNESVPEHCIFLSPPPIQTDLLADQELQRRASDIQKGWLQRRVALLASTLHHSLMTVGESNPLKLI